MTIAIAYYTLNRGENCKCLLKEKERKKKKDRNNIRTRLTILFLLYTPMERLKFRFIILFFFLVIRFFFFLQYSTMPGYFKNQIRPFMCRIVRLGVCAVCCCWCVRMGCQPSAHRHINITFYTYPINNWFEQFPSLSDSRFERKKKRKKNEKKMPPHAVVHSIIYINNIRLAV